MRMAVRTNLMLPRELVSRVDRLAGRRGRSRYVSEALEHAVRRDEQRQALLAAAGWLRDRPGYEHWSTSDRVVEWVRSGRSAGRDPWS
jgi:predicted transcriptional regulator